MSTSSRRQSKYKRRYKQCTRELAQLRLEVERLKQRVPREVIVIDDSSSSDEEEDEEDAVVRRPRRNQRRRPTVITSDVDDEEDEDDEDMCTICLSPRIDEVTTVCNHKFCRECIDATYRSRSRKCPLCRARFTKNPAL